MPADRRVVRLATVCVALLPLLSTGCGLLAAVAVPLITDAIEGDNDDGGDPTVLDVRNDASSTERMVRIEVARADGTHEPYGYDVDEAPGRGKSLKNIFDAGPHWVRVVYASGWRSRARSILVVKDDTVTLTFQRVAADFSAMNGTWLGRAETGAGAALTYGFTVAGAGLASARTVDGVADAATGTLAETSEGVFRLSWSDTTVAALVTDATHTHAGLLLGDGTTGALQKGATAPLPTGLDADAVGTWSGTQVRFAGATLTPASVDAANATVSVQQHWDGADGFGYRTAGVDALTVAPGTLAYDGAAEDALAVALSLRLFLTPDLAFAFARLDLAGGATFPDSARYQLLEQAP
jgi:hypothetical protein